MKIPEDKRKDLLLLAYKIELIKLQSNFKKYESEFQNLLHQICKEHNKTLADIEYYDLEEGIITFKDENKGE